MKIPHPPLLVITDRKLTGGEEKLIQVVEKTLKAGCRWIMVREKDMPDNKRRQLSYEVMEIANRFNAKVMVNKSLEVALECGAQGVHLPWGLPITEARQKLGHGKLLGVSTHSLKEALHAEREGADYITFSPVFKTVSKKDHTIVPRGVEKLREVASRVSIPVIALGGITKENARLCIEVGATGVAVLGSVMSSPNPEEATKEILAAILSAKPTYRW